jgi:hypothetical protein
VTTNSGTRRDLREREKKKLDSVVVVVVVVRGIMRCK